MGLSFITEGAIPFAAGDQPHGGIFVIGVITNPVQYLISVVVGAVIGMIVMSFTKKPLNK